MEQSEVDKIVGRNVKAEIQRGNYRIKDFHQRVKIRSYKSFSQRLSGQVQFTAYELAKIAAILGITEDVLFAGVDRSPFCETT